MKSSSLFAVDGQSEPWHAFLVPSVPNIARKLFGAFYLA